MALARAVASIRHRAVALVRARVEGRVWPGQGQGSARITDRAVASIRHRIVALVKARVNGRV